MRKFLSCLAVYASAGLVMSFGLACAVPLAGLAAVAALTHRRRDALGLIGGVWAVNQSVGYGFLAYPHNAASYGWGLALGAVALGGTVAVSFIAAQYRGLKAAALGFIAAFAVYEGGLYALTRLVGGETIAYEPTEIARVFAVNLAGFVLLYAVSLGGERYAGWSRHLGLVDRRTGLVRS